MCRARLAFRGASPFLGNSQGTSKTLHCRAFRAGDKIYHRSCRKCRMVSVLATHRSLGVGKLPYAQCKLRTRMPHLRKYSAGHPNHSLRSRHVVSCGHRPFRCRWQADIADLRKIFAYDGQHIEEPVA
jgi:hypothetical protein